jgi:hypothetical protein
MPTHKQTQNNSKLYKVLLSRNEPQTIGGGTLYVGALYTIGSFVGPDDFSNMELISGTMNQVGCVFRATSDTPTAFANGSEISYDGEPYIVSKDENGEFNPSINTIGLIDWIKDDDGTYDICNSSNDVNLFPEDKTYITIQQNNLTDVYRARLASGIISLRTPGINIILNHTQVTIEVKL